VGSAAVEAIRQRGFDVILVPTQNLPNHARIIHPLGAAGFTDEALEELSRAFQDTTGC
jgi:pyridoxal/pyridoxine/pyridoxamine kinase